MDLACEISLLFCTEAERLRCFVCTSGKEDIRMGLALCKAAMVGLEKIWKSNEVTTHTQVELMEALIFQKNVWS